MSDPVINGIKFFQDNISNNILFFSGRLGSVETKVLLKSNLNDILTANENKKNVLSLRKEAWINAGIWPPTNSQMRKFSNRYAEAIEKATVMAIWESPDSLPSEQQLIKHFNPICEQVPLRILDPVQLVGQGFDSWTLALEGKKVLVVHPFGDLIKSQYEKREALHAKALLPDFTLSVIKPPQSNGLKFSLDSWSEKFREFETQLDLFINKFEPDIALIAAGAYGMPIANLLYSKKVSSIYIGGSLQLIFGIWGARWKTNKNILSISTENWVTPEKKLRPKGSFLIEKSCYW